MKLLDLLEAKASSSNSEQAESGGTYAAAKLSKDTKKKIKQYFKDNDIPEPCDVDEMHCTILYSRKPLPDYKAAGEYKTPIIGKPKKFEAWKKRTGENILVLPLECPDMAKRHEELMKEHGATYDFPDYKPHVSFSYNFGDNKPGDLPPVDFDIEFAKEYQEDLDKD